MDLFPVGFVSIGCYFEGSRCPTGPRGMPRMMVISDVSLDRINRTGGNGGNEILVCVRIRCDETRFFIGYVAFADVSSEILKFLKILTVKL